MRRTTTWNSLHPRLCLNSSRNHVLHPLHIFMLREVRGRELFEIRGAPRQSGSRAPPSRWDRCSTPCFLVHEIHFIVLRHDVVQLELRRFVSVSSNVHHLAHTSETEWSLRRDHQPARTLLRTDVTPRLHLLEGLLNVSNTCDRRLSRTLPAASV